MHSVTKIMNFEYGHRILNHPDGIFYLIDINTTTVIPMELEKLEKEKKNRWKI